MDGLIHKNFEILWDKPSERPNMECADRGRFWLRNLRLAPS